MSSMLHENEENNWEIKLIFGNCGNRKNIFIYCKFLITIYYPLSFMQLLEKNIAMRLMIVCRPIGTVTATVIYNNILELATASNFDE